MMQVSVSSDSGDFHISGSICSLILIQVNSLDQSVSHLDVFRGPWTLTGFRKLSYGPVLSRHWITGISVMLAVTTSVWQQMGAQQLSLVQSVNALKVYVLSGHCHHSKGNSKWQDWKSESTFFCSPYFSSVFTIC